MGSKKLLRRLTWGALALMLRREALWMREEFYREHHSSDRNKIDRWWYDSPKSHIHETLYYLADRLEGKR